MGDMHSDVRDVVHLLRTEAALCRELLKAMGRERAVMVRSRLDELGSVAAEKEALLQRLQAVETGREELIGRLAGRLGCRPAEMTLSRLALEAPPAYREPLTRCRAELTDLLEHLRAENRRSEALCRHTSELLQASYGVIRGLVGNGPVYQRGGRMQGARLNGKLICNDI
jgi:flagellar biosynthesis/type III secretory pathway chaperone